MHPGLRVRLPGGHGGGDPDRRPARPGRAEAGGRFKPPITGISTHDVQVDEGPRLDRRWRRQRGLRREGSAQAEDGHAYRREHRELRPARLPGPDPVFGIGGKGETPIDLIHHDSLRFHKKSTRGTSRPRPGKTYPAGGNGKVVGIVEEDYNRPTCEGAGSFQTWGITDKRTSTGARKLVLLDLYETELGASWRARVGTGHGPLLGALLRRARRPGRGRLVRGGHALPRRDRPRGHPAGGLLGADEGRDLVGGLRANRSRPGRSSTRSTSPAASTSCASTAQTSGPARQPCGARGSSARPRSASARRATEPGRGRRAHGPEPAQPIRLRLPPACAALGSPLLW